MTLGRRIWFYATLCRLAFYVVFILGLVGASALIGLLELRSENYWLGAGCILIALLLGVALASKALRFREDVRLGMRSELKRRNYCPECGYDLRKSFDRCPECGYSRGETIEV